MKLTKFVSLLTLALVIVVAAPGCRKKPGYLTELPPGTKIGSPNNNNGDKSGTVENGNKPGEDINSKPGEQTQANPEDYKNYNRNTEIFKAYTVYFDFDSSVVKSSEKSKVTAIADHLKQDPKAAVEVEGNCDSRGTEEYNRALGERRALAVREELIALGVDPKRVLTISYGEDRPAVQGNDEAAYAKNRRDDFVLLTPP